VANWHLALLPPVRDVEPAFSWLVRCPHVCSSSYQMVPRISQHCALPQTASLSTTVISVQKVYQGTYGGDNGPLICRRPRRWRWLCRDRSWCHCNCSRVLVADSLMYDWGAVLVISKAILAKAIPAGDAPGLYGFRRCRRGVRYNAITHGRCGNITLGQIFPQLNSLGRNLSN
jgi:hypothetical protein